MADIRTQSGGLMGSRHLDDDEQNSSRDGSNQHTRVERWQDRLWPNRLLSVFTPESPALPLSNVTYIENSSSPDNAPELLTTSAGDSNSSGRNIATTSAGNMNRRRIDSKSVKRLWSPQEFAIQKNLASLAKSELGKVLEPMLGDGTGAASVLLCWGESHRCHIVPVNTANSADEVATWREINRAWYTYKGHWRRYLPFFGVRQVDIVEITIAGLMSTDNMKPVYVGMYTAQNLDAERRQLEQIIRNCQAQDSLCKYDSATGATDCRPGTCVSYNRGECPVWKYHKVQRDLLRLDTRPLLTLFFSDAGLAPSKGFLEKEGLVYSHLDILRKVNERHRPELSELRFRGVRIREDWEFGSQHIVLPLAVTLLFVMVVVAKLTFGDWATAWNVGAFFVGLAALLLTWAAHAVRRSA